jgi:hypothetical protein
MEGVVFENVRVGPEDYLRLVRELNTRYIGMDYEDTTLIAELSICIHDNTDLGERYIYKKDYHTALDNYFNKKRVRNDKN